MSVYPFTRFTSTTQGNRVIGINAQTGFVLNGAATNFFNMQISFALSQVYIAFGGTGALSIPVPNFSEFTALFDQYRIDYVECGFAFTANSQDPGVTTALPIMWVAKDYSDANIAPIADVQQYKSAQCFQLGNPAPGGYKVIRVRPTVDLQVYQGITSGFASANGKTWIETGTPDVPHYGLKCAIDSTLFGATNVQLGNLSMYFKYHLSFKNVK